MMARPSEVLDPRATARAVVFAAYREDRRSTWVQAVGRSMTPLIQPGDELLVAFGAMPDRFGQVVLFSQRGLQVAHRFVGWDTRGDVPMLLAKGDAEILADAPVPMDQVLGVVRGLRHGPDRSPTSVGLDGRPAAAIAQVSWWSDRGVRLARRLTRPMPTSIGRPLLGAAVFLARVPTRIVSAPTNRLDR
jgi:hypothetical protein